MSQATAGTLDITFKASADLTGLKYHFVKLDADGDIVACVAQELSIGILQNEPDVIGKAARVRLLGTSKLVMGAICDEMALLTPDIDGHGAVAIVDEDFVGAIALEAATAADEIIEVLITKLQLVVTA